MANSLYGVREGERCPGCGYRRNEYPHFRTCVPRQKWPEDMQGEPRRKRVVVNGLVLDHDDPRAQAVSGEASSPASVALADAGGAGSASSPEAAPTPKWEVWGELGSSLPDNQMIERRVDRAALSDALSAASSGDTIYVNPNGGDVIHMMSYCECGWRIPETSKNPKAAMRLHRAKSKAHKES